MRNGLGRNRDVMAVSTLIHLWDAPHKPLFQAAFAAALVTIGWWPLGVWLGLPEPAFAPVVLWHVHELLFGFAAAAVGGYLMTALPSWTVRPPIKGKFLKSLLMLWIAARIATAAANHLPVGLLVVINSGYFLMLAGMICHQVTAAQVYRKIGFGLAVLALGVAETLFLIAAMTDNFEISKTVTQLVLLGFALLIVVIAGRAIPAFTRNWLLQTKCKTTQVSNSPGAQNLAQTLLITALACQLAGGQTAMAIVLLSAAVAVIYSMRHWGIVSSFSNPLLAALHLSYLWLPIGFVLVALDVFFQDLFRWEASIHAITIGAMSGLIMAISGRAAAHQPDGILRAHPSFAFAVLLITLTTLARLAAPIFSNHWTELVMVAAALWCLGWALFIAYFLPVMLAPSPRPVLSGSKHQP